MCHATDTINNINKSNKGAQTLKNPLTGLAGLLSHLSLATLVSQALFYKQHQPFLIPPQQWQ